MPHIELNVTADDLDTLHIAAASALKLLPGAKIDSYTATGSAPIPPEVDVGVLAETLRSAFRTLPGITVTIIEEQPRP